LETGHTLRRRSASARADDLDGTGRQGPVWPSPMVRTRKVWLGADGVAGGYGVRTVEACKKCATASEDGMGGDGIPSTWTMVDF